MKWWQDRHLENKLQNSSSDRPRAGKRSKLRSLENADVCLLEGTKAGAFVRSIFIAL